MGIQKTIFMIEKVRRVTTDVEQINADSFLNTSDIVAFIVTDKPIVENSYYNNICLNVDCAIRIYRT